MPITDRNHFSHAAIEEADRKSIIQTRVVVARGFFLVFILYGTCRNVSIIACFISQGLTGASNIMFRLYCDAFQN